MDKRGITNYKLAKMLSCSQTTIANWLNGKTMPKGAMRKNLLNVLGMRESELFPVGNISEIIVPEYNEELIAYLQEVKDKYGIMFDLSRVHSLEEIKATVAFFRMMRQQSGDAE